MNIEKWIGFLIILFLIDTLVVVGLYLAWIKKKTNNKVVPNSFPYNASKKQATTWYIVWIIAIHLNLAVYTLITWLFTKGSDPNDGMLYVIAFFVTALGYTMVLLITYPTIKFAVTKKIKKGQNKHSGTE